MSTLPVATSISTADFALISTGVEPSAKAIEHGITKIITVRINDKTDLNIFFISNSPFNRIYVNNAVDYHRIF